MTTTVRSGRRLMRSAAWMWLIGGIVYLVCETVAASCYPGYSYARDYISALGVPGESPSATMMNVGAFIVHGLLFAAAGVMAASSVAGKRTARIGFVVLATMNGVGNVMVGLFHTGDSSLHGVGALLAIVGGNAALVVAAGLLCQTPGLYRGASRVAGVFGIGCFVAFLVVAGSGSGVEGAVERGSVYTIIGWDVVTGMVLLTGLRRPHRGDG